MYWFGNGQDGVWNMHNMRYSLNVLAIWGRAVADDPPITGDDEEELTVTIPQRLGKSLLLDSRSLVAHFHYGRQQADIMKTDLLDRYRAFANEMVCAVDNQKKPIAS